MSEPKDDQHPLVIIQWVDSHGVGDSWETVEDVLESDKHITISSVGWLIERDAEGLTLAPNLSEIPHYGMVRGALYIPAQSVTRVTELKTHFFKKA